MDPSNNPNQYPYQQNYQLPPGLYNQKNPQNPNPNLISFSKQPQFYSEERNLKYQFPSKNADFLDPNRNTTSNFKAEGVSNIYKANPDAIVEHLDLDNFKAKLCPINYTHNHKHCPFYHNSKDRKRVGNFYISELCEFCENCPNGDKCGKSHNRVEQLYRPEKYKTKFCSFYPGNLDKCDYGIYCSFAHSESDIVVDLIHNYEYDKDFFMFIFKTVWCPFNLIPHDRGLCVYAHNYQDFRRKPNLCYYDPTPCPNWKTSEFIVNYEDACPNHYNCDKSHGWKESEFHPLNYKTRPCPNGMNCPKTLDCPFYHNSQDQRLVGQQIHCKIFKYYPKNRIVTNTFKITNQQQQIGAQHDFTMEDRHNSLTNLHILNQDFEKNMKLYSGEYTDIYQRNNSVPIIKHNSSTNLPLPPQQHQEQLNRNFHSNSFNNLDFLVQNQSQNNKNPNSNNAYNPMMWGTNQSLNYPNKQQGFNVNAPANANMKSYQPMGGNYPTPIQRSSPKTLQNQGNMMKRPSDTSSKNPTHFQIKSNQNQIYNENILNSSDSSFTKQETDNFQFGFEKKEDIINKSTNSDKKNKNNDSKVLIENEIINMEVSDISKGKERLRKIVMLENTEDSQKEKIQGNTSNNNNKYDPESSVDDHNENILKEICEEDQK